MATVKVLPGQSNKQRQKIMNAQNTAATENAKSGLTAFRYSELREYEQQKQKNSAVSRIKTIKVNSNPVPGKTVIGPLAGRGGGGLGGMFGNKANR